jgi:hypothetical protein
MFKVIFYDFESGIFDGTVIFDSIVFPLSFGVPEIQNKKAMGLTHGL